MGWIGDERIWGLGMEALGVTWPKNGGMGSSPRDGRPGKSEIENGWGPKTESWRIVSERWIWALGRNRDPT